MSAWTKKDIKSLCGHLDTFWLLRRPQSHVTNEFLTALRAAIAKNKEEIVLAGIRAARATCAERYELNCRTIGNQLVRFTEYGQPDELIERFTKLAREQDVGEKMEEARLHRVLAEGLPPEVEAYDPVPAVRTA